MLQFSPSNLSLNYSHPDCSAGFAYAKREEEIRGCFSKIEQAIEQDNMIEAVAFGQLASDLALELPEGSALRSAALENFARVRIRQGRLDQASELLSTSCKLHREFYRLERLVTVTKCLVDVECKRIGADKAAENFLELATWLTNENLSVLDEDLFVAQLITNLHFCDFSIGRGNITDAIKVGKVVYRESTQLFGADHPITIEAGVRIAEGLSIRGEFSKAANFAQKLAVRLNGAHDVESRWLRARLLLLSNSDMPLDNPDSCAIVEQRVRVAEDLIESLAEDRAVPCEALGRASSLVDLQLSEIERTRGGLDEAQECLERVVELGYSGGYHELGYYLMALSGLGEIHALRGNLIDAIAARWTEIEVRKEHVADSEVIILDRLEMIIQYEGELENIKGRCDARQAKLGMMLNSSQELTETLFDEIEFLAQDLCVLEDRDRLDALVSIMEPFCSNETILGKCMLVRRASHAAYIAELDNEDGLVLDLRRQAYTSAMELMGENPVMFAASAVDLASTLLDSEETSEASQVLEHLERLLRMNQHETLFYAKTLSLLGRLSLLVEQSDATVTKAAHYFTRSAEILVKLGLEHTYDYARTQEALGSLEYECSRESGEFKHTEAAYRTLNKAVDIFIIAGYGSTEAVKELLGYLLQLAPILLESGRLSPAEREEVRCAMENHKEQFERIG